VSTLPPRPTPEEVAGAIERVCGGDGRVMANELLHLRAEVAALRETLPLLTICDLRELADVLSTYYWETPFEREKMVEKLRNTADALEGRGA
jgi:hypothetical protein